jgi:hypothetical protein
MPAGEGDLKVSDLNGAPFDFNGVPHALHRMYSRGPFRVLQRLTPVGWTPGGGDPPDADSAPQYCAGAEVHVGDVRVIVGDDGRTHVILGPDPARPEYHVTIEAKVDTLDAPGHPGSTSDDPHPLRGVPHLNVAMPIFPQKRYGESGVWPDGPSSADHPADYVVPG